MYKIIVMVSTVSKKLFRVKKKSKKTGFEHKYVQNIKLTLQALTRSATVVDDFTHLETGILILEHFIHPECIMSYTSTALLIPMKSLKFFHDKLEKV